MESKQARYRAVFMPYGDVERGGYSPSSQEVRAPITEFGLAITVFVHSRRERKQIAKPCSRMAGNVYRERYIPEQLQTALAILRRKQVEARTGLRAIAIYSKIAAGELPAAVRLGEHGH